MTSKNVHNVQPDIYLEPLRSPSKSESKQSESALFGSVSHMEILCVLTYMMKIRDQTT